MTSLQFWLDPQFWPYLVMPIGGAMVGLFCWIFLLPKDEKKVGRRPSR